jgi:hypothetical protein
MPLQITCAMCGGQIEPDDLALRQELIACPYCSTINRITPTGTEKSAETIRNRQRPEGVKVERIGPRKYLFWVKGARRISLPKVGIFFFVILLSTVFVFHIQFFPISLCVAALLAIPFATLSAITGKNSFYMRPVKLDGYILYTSESTNIWGLRHRILVEDIRQIYSVFHPDLFAIHRPSQSDRRIRFTRYINVGYCSVYVLTRDGKRIALVDGIQDEKVALYIEEQLELALGMFNLPVYGDQNLPRDIKTKIPSTLSEKLEIETLSCKSCGGDLPLSPDTYQRGYLVCQYCHVLTLLYAPGKNKPVLGLPKLNSPNFQYKVIKRDKLLRIRSREMKDEDSVLILSKTHLKFRTSASKTFLSLSISEILDIYAKEQESDGPIFSLGVFNNKKWEDELAYSGNLDTIHKRVFEDLFYQVVAKNTEGEEVCLLDKIRNPYEALVFAEYLSHIYSLKRDIKNPRG